MSVYGRLVRPLLFRLDPERAHELALRSLGAAAPILGRRSPAHRPELAVRLWDLDFPSPVGLAAGFDKSARAAPAWSGLGFGFAEIGTVTARPQPGNPRPRIFRLPEDRALINRLGFNNEGAEAVAARLARWRRRGLLGRIPLGVNIGKSRVTPAASAGDDYAESLRALWGFADYVVVNVSSPNTPGLRDLQAVAALLPIVDRLRAVNAECAGRAGRSPRPLLVKLAPDLADEQFDEVVDLARDRLDGLVIGNTTLARRGLSSPAEAAGQEGGLSGAPLRDRNRALIARAADRASGRLPIIGVGGIFDADDAWEALAAGASLVQVYTGFVYGGPAVPGRIANGLADRIRAAGIAAPEATTRAS